MYKLKYTLKICDLSTYMFFFLFPSSSKLLEGWVMLFLSFLVSPMVFSTRLGICSVLRKQLHILSSFWKYAGDLVYCWFSNVCNKLPRILAACQWTLCHITVDIKELGSCLADWFCLSWGCGQTVEQVGSHIKDWWALEHLLPNSLMWLLAHLGSSVCWPEASVPLP